MSNSKYIHLVSDATGATLQGLVEAGLSQFDHGDVQKKLWPQVRSASQLERVISDLEVHGGLVFYTLLDPALVGRLEEASRLLGLPCVAIMPTILNGMEAFFGAEPSRRPGLQHKLDESYFARMEAIDFAMGFDDGQNLEGIETADVILVGVSRTSKTPTCVYLARQGIRAANIPLVREVSFPDHVLELKTPLFVGLTESVDRLIELRSSRLKLDRRRDISPNSYIDPEKIEEEVAWATRFFRSQGWPVIDVTKRSVEETASEVLVLLQHKRGSL